ncbi:4-hydroxy-tetrahydrodipicolinate reductase [Formicincola oecophyllae]|uniref:4-hydroxy-tetrahydrodipicolinate reductase n=1 Tax=Formicincola oecophyllae TaxID=2558361 RepID=A0A4Y6UAA7_9PROT|nr:4-hydroxy-tetrahydrodipicolinate reductase [Formicincola oecophyllae]QDH13311.1 4-hydroxy-tetrahydrodipicolinate reductase [Formicincola oecophyllae]
MTTTATKPAPLRLGIAGITGRLGHLIAQEALKPHSGFTLAGGLTRHPEQAKGLVPEGTLLTNNPHDLAQSCDVLVDVSHHAQTIPLAEALMAVRQAGHKVSWVLGTTGLGGQEQAALQSAAQGLPVLVAANFSPALTALLTLARQLGATLPAEDYDAEIMEIHHRHKKDAPSGTALAIGHAVAEGRGVDFEQAKRIDQNSPRTDHKGAIGFASMRGGAVVGLHDLRFLGDDEEITLSHRALDRRVFARGALLAARWLGAPGRASGLYGMADALGLKW